MIIKKFEEIVQRFPGKTAIKTSTKSLTYAELDSYANRVAHALANENKSETTGGNHRQVPLLFDHGIEMVVGIIGTLKADKTYVPLDTYFPGKRLLYILEDCEAEILLTDNRNHQLANELSEHTGNKVRVLNIETIGNEIPGTTFPRQASEERTAYILYTSGSTGKPKGVYQILRNVWYYTWNWIKRFNITENDRMSLFTSFCHDGSVQDMFAALLAGAALYPYSIKNTGSTDELYRLLTDEKLTIWHSVPTLYRYFANTLTGKDVFNDIRWVLLGGEPLRPHDLELYRAYFPHARLANVYGQTESSVSTICTISPTDTFDDVCLGEPLEETKILLVTEQGNTVETIGIGEIVVDCDYIAPGYWKDNRDIDEVFTHDEELGRLYWTGDLGRLSMDGSIKAIGRKDFQIKIRGFRVETGEIESVLLRHPLVEEVVVLAKEDENIDTYLCAYIVSEIPINPTELREFLAAELPDYMIPRFFITLDEMPLTPNGKIDRKRLPEPEPEITLEAEYEPPGTEIEKKIAAIWQEVLGVEQVGINDNFISRGGHSLLVISIITKIHQEFNVELELNDVFDNPTVRQLSQLVMKSEKTVFFSIPAAEKKDYYMLSPAQERLYVLYCLSPRNTGYNIPGGIELSGKVDKERIEEAVKKIIQRHECLRTSFVTIDGKPVQRVHDRVEFKLDYYDLPARGGSNHEVLKGFVRPFQLEKVPLLRIGLIKTAENKHILATDIHHIITDAHSMIVIFPKDFDAIYAGNALPPLQIQYKDFSQWQNRHRSSPAVKKHEEFWQEEFKDGVPVLELPLDYVRPAKDNYQGDWVMFHLNAAETGDFKKILREFETTLFMGLLALYNVLLFKLSGQEDLVVGTPTAGRDHPDLLPVMGMFVNMLVLRNFPHGKKTFSQFLKEVKERALNAFAHQDYQFENLVEKMAPERKPGRNPLFDVNITLQNAAEVSSQPAEKPGESPGIETGASKFDLSLEIMETSDSLYCRFEYKTRLFKRETIRRFAAYFKEILAAVIKDKNIRLEDIRIAHDLMEPTTKTPEMEFQF